MPVLKDLKEMVEVDVEETIFDKQLLLHANSGIAYLKNNLIPVSRITELTEQTEWSLREDDYDVVLNWLHFYVLQRFDRQIGATTLNWINQEMTDLFYHLKAGYAYEE